MSVELVEEVHEQVNLQGADAQHHVLLRLGSVAAVVASQLLALHPQVGQLLKLPRQPQRCEAKVITSTARNVEVELMADVWVQYLQWEHHQGHADEDDHQQLGRPDLRRDVPVAHGGESDDAEVEGVEQRQMLPGSFQVLDPTGSAQKKTTHDMRQGDEKMRKTFPFWQSRLLASLLDSVSNLICLRSKGTRINGSLGSCCVCRLT